MRILKQMIEKKLQLHSEFMLNRQYLRGIWQFYCCINLSLAVLRLNGVEYDENLFKNRNMVWRRWLASGGVPDDKKLKKMQGYIKEDMKIVIQALSLIQEINENKQFEISQFFCPKSSFIGCLAYEFPE